MTTDLEWNVRETAQQQAERQAAAQKREQLETEQRAILRRNLPIYREELAAAERARTYWQAEHARLLGVVDQCYAVYVRAMHAESGGEVPRGPSGELVVAIDLSDDHPETMRDRPAKPQWAAYKRAVAAAQEAGANALLAETAVPNAAHNVRVAEEASR